MTRTASEAIAWMKNQSEHGYSNWGGKCLMDVRESLDIGSRDGWAGLAYDRAHYKHPATHGARVPRGVAFFWHGGSQGYGHVVLSVGGGLCYSNDVRRRGCIDLVSIDGITQAWGQRPMGWTEDLNGVHYFNSKPVASEWSHGDVYVEKLHRHVLDSDSVRRLAWRMLQHQQVPAKKVRITGNYTLGLATAVRYWQRNVYDGPPDVDDGNSVSNRQARVLFGPDHNVIEVSR